LASALGYSEAAGLIADIATVYVVAVSGVTAAYFNGFNAMESDVAACQQMIGKLIEPVTGLLDKFIEDKDQKAQLAHDLATMADRHAQDLALAQIEVNKAEAASGSDVQGRLASGCWLDLRCRLCLPLCACNLSWCLCL
jgi:hypothetical protein